jgi:Flp pilus assembly pilin Flp
LFRDQSGASAVEYGLILALSVGLAFMLVHFFGRAFKARTSADTVTEEPSALHDAGTKSADGGFIRRGVVIPP